MDPEQRSAHAVALALLRSPSAIRQRGCRPAAAGMQWRTPRGRTVLCARNSGKSGLALLARQGVSCGLKADDVAADMMVHHGWEKLALAQS